LAEFIEEGIQMYHVSDCPMFRHEIWKTHSYKSGCTLNFCLNHQSTSTSETRRSSTLQETEPGHFAVSLQELTNASW